jgi:hypothetical protein
VGLAGLASAMGVGRFAFTPLLPLMQQAGTLTLAEGGTLARANYLGYLVGALACMALTPPPGRLARIGLVAVAVVTAGMGVPGPFAGWVALRFLAGVASAFVLVGVSSWVLPILATGGRAPLAGWVYAGVGTGIVGAGLVGLGTGVMRLSPGVAWLFLAACSAAVAVVGWRPLGTPAPSPAPGASPAEGRLRGRTGWLVASYGAFGLGYIVPATFLPAAARSVVADPAVFAWTWPVFGLAGAISTLLVSRAWARTPPRRVWAAAQVVMAMGVVAPALRLDLPALLWCAVWVGGTFMVVTMAGIQEARRIGGAAAHRLVAAMTAAFAVGQLLGPFLVTSLGPGASPGAPLPYALAAAVLLAGAAALALGPRDSPPPVG